MSEKKVIKGSGGGKGGGSSAGAVEAPNSLRSSSIVRVLELLSEGEIVGVVGGLKGVYLNDTPVMNDDGSTNFSGVGYDERFGLPSQPYMAGFPSAESEVNVGVAITAASPAVKTTSSNKVDAARITVLLPQGLSLQDTKTGDLNGNSVSFQFDRKPSGSGTWEAVGAPITITGKCTAPYEKQYRVEKPANSSTTWDVRLRRISADDANTASKSAITFSRITEIQDVKLEYDNSAYVGVAVDAQSVGNQIPTRSYMVKGLKVQIPSNYNPITRVYTGTWDGTFQTAWSDNPAWVLYDLLTHDRYGMGEFISPSQVNKFSFYDAAVYNDQLVPDGNGGLEPRFTFNTVINNRADALTLLQNVAGSFRASLTYSGGVVGVNQDRPSAPVKVVTKANVLDGKFSYSSTGLQDRHTAVNMTWNDKADRYLPKVSTVTDDAGIQRYGYNLLETAAMGATTEGQAIRNAKWILDTEINQTELVNFTMALNGFDLQLGDVIKLYDEDYANQVGAGRIVSATATSITLDRPVTIQANATIDVQDPSGVGLITKTITNPAGTYTTVNVSTMSALPLAKADFIVTSAVAPRQFRIYNLTQNEPGQINVQCLYYDPNKYARVELGINIPSPIFSAIDQRVIGNVTNVQITTGGIVTAEKITRSLNLGWTPPLVGIATSYILKWRRNKAEWVTVTGLESPIAEIRNIDQGSYDFMIYAVNINGVQSSGTSATFTVDLQGGTGSALFPVTNLQIQGGTGTNFTGTDCNVEWVNPLSNSNTIVTLKDFVVNVYSTGGTLLRTEYVDAVAPGAKAYYQYTFSKNKQDGGPNRSFRIDVLARDTLNMTASPTSATFTNPAPAVLNNVSVLGAFQSIKVLFDKPADSDLAGYLIWMSTTANFTPAATNLVADTTATFTSFTGLLADTSYYVRVAAYDTFGSSKTGAGLNVSGQFNAATFASVGVQSGATLPTSGMKAGDQFFNTTDNRLYTYTGTVWKGAGIAQGPTTPSTGSEGDLFANTTDGKLYQYHSGAWSAAVQSTDFVGQLVTSQIADNAIAATKIADGAVSGVKLANLAVDTTKIVDSAITSVKLGNSAVTASKTALNAIDPLSGNLTANSVTANNIVGRTITAQQIATGAITANEIAGNTITGDKIVGRTITAANIVAGSITANEIAANSITVDRLKTGSITSQYIAAGAITGDTFAANSISGTKIIAGSISADRLTANSITSAQIQAGAISASVLAASSITGGLIAGSAITGDKIAGNTITGNLIVANTITADKLNVINLNAISSTLGSVTLDNGANGGRLATSGKGWHNDGVTGVIMYKDTARSFFEAKAGNDCVSITSDGGSSIRFGTPGNETFYVDSAGNMRINTINVIGTLQLQNNSVTVPAEMHGSGGAGPFYPSGSATTPVYASQITVPFPAAAKVQILVTWQASAGSSGSNTSIRVTCDGGEVFFTSDSNLQGYAFSHVASGTATVGAGNHTFQLEFGNNWTQGSWTLGRWSMTILGVMK